MDGWVGGWTDESINDELPPMHSVLGSNQQLESQAGGAPPGKWIALFRGCIAMCLRPRCGWEPADFPDHLCPK